MTPEVTNYKCPACEAPLRYDETTGRLHCDYCESTYAVQEVEAMIAAAEKKRSQPIRQQRRKNRPPINRRQMIAASGNNPVKTAHGMQMNKPFTPISARHARRN